MRKDDSLALKAIRSDQDQLLDELYSINAEFVKQYPDSYVSWDLQRVKTEGMDATEAEEAYNAMSERLRNSVAGKKAAAHIKKLKRTAIGNPAPLFTQADTEGKPVSLASFRGKYVLLDFWASWCSPCRDENPNVVKAFKQFRDKKLEIISVSLDSKKKDWLNAINEDGMPWIHVCDLKGTKNSVALLYGVIAVPQNFLVDPDGKIIAHNLRGEELIPALEKLIK
jgi:peroxiredoxin